jgi:hypothetical protein
MTRLKAEQKIPDDALVYWSRDLAHRELKEMTGQDFGYDVAAWKRWFKDPKSKKKKQN